MLNNGTTALLPEPKMRDLGFTDRVPSHWYRVVSVAPEITFNVTIDKETGTYEEYVIDEVYGQPYHFLTYDAPAAYTTHEGVKKQLELLQEAGLDIQVDFDAYDLRD